VAYGATGATGTLPQCHSQKCHRMPQSKCHSSTVYKLQIKLLENIVIKTKDIYQLLKRNDWEFYHRAKDRHQIFRHTNSPAFYTSSKEVHHMKTGEIYQELKRNGWHFKRSGRGSHELWSHPSGKTIVVSLKSKTHDVPYGTGRKLLSKIRQVSP
jgi:predicted RNA binding protein YcfA (HicA-like mRNA interferase family)